MSRGARRARAGFLLAAIGMAAVLGCGPDPGRLAAATDDVETVTREHLDAFERGDFDAWAATFTRDGLLIAADPFDVIGGPDSLAAAMHREYDAALNEGLRLRIRTTDLRIGLTRQLNRAWLSDELQYVVQYGTDSLDLRMRFSGVLVKEHRRWRFDVVNLSRPLAASKVASSIASGDVTPPIAIASGSRGNGEIERMVRRALADTSRLIGLLGRDETVQVIGPEPGARAIGAEAARALLRRELGRRGTFAIVGHELLVRRRGRLAWAAANLVRDEPGPAGPMRVPYRGVLVFVACGEHCWRLVQAHLSNGIKDPA